jgi:mRNA (guanine-N7-)-methyltransferase
VKFEFQLGFEGDEVVNVPEYLLNFDVLVEMAKRHSLKLTLKKTFSEFFNENSAKSEYNFLIKIIKALEPVYTASESEDKDKKARLESGDFEFLNEKLKDDSFRNDLRDNEAYMTISKSEWEAISLYLVFAFEKV